MVVAAAEIPAVVVADSAGSAAVDLMVAALGGIGNCREQGIGI